MSNKVRCYYCGYECNEEELVKEKVEGLEIEKETCPACHKDVLYDLKEVGGETHTFATRV